MVSAQGWVKNYPHGFGGGVGFDVKQTPDGGYIMVGELDYPTGAIRHYIRLIKTDAEGEVQWEKIYGDGEVLSENGRAVRPLSDGGYAVAGSKDSGNFPYGKMLLMRTDALGDTLWTRAYDSGDGAAAAYSLYPTPDGGFILGGEHTGVDSNLFNSAIFIVKTDADGNVEWMIDPEPDFTPGALAASRIMDIRRLSAGGYIAAGESNGQGLLVRIDETGDTLWTKKYGLTTGDRFFSVAEAPDGGFVVAGESTGFAGNSPVVVKTDADGNMEWEQYPVGIFWGAATGIIPATDGGYVFTGSQTDFWGTPSNPNGLAVAGFLTRIDESGQVVWNRNLGNPLSNQYYNGAALSATADGGYIITGGNNFTAFLMKTDHLGLQVSNWVQGRVVVDDDENCEAGASETGLEEWIIEIRKGNEYLYASTDDQGRYEILLDTGDYVLRAIMPNLYWESCAGEVSISLTTFYDTTAVDFPINAIVDCPLMTVDVSTSFLRRCFENDYTVQYCNHGTAAAEDALVEITLDPYLSMISADIPYQDLGDGLYSFDIGTVEVGECSSFQFTVYLDCDNTVLGQTHCVEAHIFPDSLCIDPTAGLPLIDLSGACVNDSISFRIANIGDTDMDSPVNYIVIEDDVMYMQGPFQLDAGEEMTVQLQASGSTYRMETELMPGAMNDLLVSAFVEGCAPNGGPFNTGFVNWFPMYNGNTFVDIDCRPNIGAYDPNDKLAFPRGYGDEHYIRAGDEIDYLIRFQNTGTDTAFNVVIRDTLSAALDPATIRPGASSHPYRFELLGAGVVKFIFDNIMLPDSNVNEPASHGFVQFRIGQRQDLPVGTVIENRAAIYFDFNEPVITDPVFHTIGEDFIEVVNATVEPWARPSAIRIAPNPFAEEAEITIDGALIGSGTFYLYDQTGRLLAGQRFHGNTFRFRVENLPTGLYLFRIEAEGRLLGSGKMVVGGR
jgi:uncharacterized repeat protein (TIGR01451 family)